MEALSKLRNMVGLFLECSGSNSHDRHARILFQCLEPICSGGDEISLFEVSAGGRGSPRPIHCCRHKGKCKAVAGMEALLATLCALVSGKQAHDLLRARCGGSLSWAHCPFSLWKDQR